MQINEFGFLRVAAASPRLRVADCAFNTQEMKAVIERAVKENVQIVCFPELSITGYTCGDLFFQEALQRKAVDSLAELTAFMKEKPFLVAIVGLPLKISSSLFNVAAVISAEGILGLVPKKNIPNDREFYEKRWFASGNDLHLFSVDMHGEKVPITPGGMIFHTPYANFGIEICEDLWAPAPPSSALALQGADILFNLSASNELVGKHQYRKSLVIQQSGQCNAAYVYASAGQGESTTDLVFSGACLIAENGSLLAESKRFSLESELIIADIDIDALRHDRIKNTNYLTIMPDCSLEIDCIIPSVNAGKWYRTFNPYPFIPSEDTAGEHLQEVFQIQTHGLAQRLRHTGATTAVLGISGGLDSTLALLVTIKAFDTLGLPRENIHGITMPGFGTTKRTYHNAVELMKSTGVTLKEISIVEAVTQHFRDIGHPVDEHNVTYENSQARERTQILMDYANKTGGLVVGTGNLSELALGWATYNGDHMSMYAVNASVPKTLVATLVRWIADHRMEEPARSILHDVLDTPFSPELLPADKEGQIAQKTEHVVGPYVLHDFFLHRMLRYGDGPKRIFLLACQAFSKAYAADEIGQWLRVFYKRFFAQQFKRSCMPDGPKVGSVNLSPRGDWRMPSDAVADTWLNELKNDPRIHNPEPRISKH